MERSKLSLLESQQGVELTEASLARVYKHYQDHGFAVITSWRGDADKKTNIKNLNTLKSEVRAAGYGFIPIVGVWHEEGMPAPSEEPSLFIPASKNREQGKDIKKQLRRLVVSLGKKYSQDAVVWSPGGQVEIISTHQRTGKGVGYPLFQFNKFRPKAVGIAYSSFRNGKFTFESKNGADRFNFYFAKPPASAIEALLRKGRGEIVFVPMV